MSMKICDFCGEPDGQWKYPSKVWDVGSWVDDGSDGIPWYACESCSSLIEEEDLKGLVGRAIDHQIKNPGKAFGPILRDMDRAQIKNQLYYLYVKWLKYRKGGREPA